MSRSELRSPATTSTSANVNAPGEVELTLRDIEAGFSALPRARLARLVTWGGAAAVIALVAYRWQEGRDRTSLVIIAVVLLGLLATNRSPARRIAKRVYASLSDDTKRLSVSVDETGFCVKSGGAESQLPWTDVRRCVEARDVFVVFVSREDAQILPKRAFSDADVAAIRQWSKSKVVRHDEPWLTAALRTRMMIWLAVFAVVWAAWLLLGNR